MKNYKSNTVVMIGGKPLGTLRERLLEHLDDLSRQQRLVADFLLENLQQVPFLSVPQLAERAGASEATVVRLCQRIGFRGFSELKMELVETMRHEMQSQEMPGEKTGADGERADALNAVAELDQHNIRRTVEGIDRTAFEHVASMLFRADHVFVFGLGISAYLSDFAAYLFTEHGLRATSFGTRFTSPREQLVVLRPTDLVLAFSFPPYSRQTLEVLEEARERGARTVAITDRPGAPAVPLADQALTVSSHGMMFTNSTAAVGVLLNALLVQIASQHRGETVEALSRINRILRDQSYLIDETD
jgi:DNA-binding MurR/RpiR family transcriptional regulator